MPNHFHGIIGFDNKVIQLNTSKEPDLGKIISRFKNDSRRRVVSIYEENVAKDLPIKNSDNGETGSPLRIDRFNPYKF